MSRFFSQIFAWNSSDAIAGSRHRIGKRLNGSRRTVGAFVLAVVLIGQGAHGAIRTVTKNTDNNPSRAANAGELRYEINQAVAADTIVFDPTFFSVPRTILLHPDLYGGLFVTKNLTITGPGPANLIIDAGGISARTFTFGVVTASISGLTITGGKAPQEGGIRSFSFRHSMLVGVESIPAARSR